MTDRETALTKERDAWRRVAEALVVRTKHGPYGAGGPGPCDRDCAKCAYDALASGRVQS